MAAPLTSRNYYVASTIIGLFFIFFSFITNYGRKKPHPGSFSKSLLRIAVITTLSLTYVSEVVFVLLRQNDLNVEVLDHVISATFFALAWIATLARQRLLVMEIVGLSVIALAFGLSHLVLVVLGHGLALQDKAIVGLQAGRWLVTAGICIDSVVSYLIKPRQRGQDGESAPLLSGTASDSVSGSTTYDTEQDDTQQDADRSFDSDSDGESDDEDDDGAKDSHSRRLRKSGSWLVYLRNFKVFMPYLVPRKDHKVQLCIGLCISVLVLQRLLTILIPQQLGIVTDKLITGSLPYKDMTIYFVMIFVGGGGSSVLAMTEELAKIPIEQFSYRQLTNAAFNHVMALTMEFHSDKDSAEIMKAVEQGEALNNILQTAILEMLPTVMDMFLAFVTLYVKFNSSVALSMLSASLAYLAAEVVVSSWNIENRRLLTKTERKQSRVMHQAVQGWQTVSAFNMFSYENFRFGSAVERRLTAERNWKVRDQLTDGLLEIIPPVTFYLLALLVMHEIYVGRSSVGDFVFLIQYWDALFWPLKFLSHEYRYVMRDLIDAERLLDLLSTEPTIKDKEDAIDLVNIEGRVEFQDVGFTYDQKREAIHNVNISAEPGETIAFVGATGAGKSTLAKLLMRYYDVTSGSIRVDGHDIRDVTQGSLRDVLGVVPQDPLLFNASILENLRYAKLSASDEEIYDACRGAAIHDKIAAFPEGYHTKVGEQGIKLSGGEVQRLAIARVFLKNPPILLFDEATSAVDTETEAVIQGALKRLSYKRTTFVIAHRLSTVIRANQILVVDSGTILERGTHDELLRSGSKYANLWLKQLGEDFPERPSLEL
ncbi:hypothetical protein QQS21_000810 [Conoideocrella luteorostrata]|uniref:Abc transporter n=1 Tax=Conoideocrella luteorostrata TaxID=1105319 RepID=A0AAJ0G3R5_9HYPO|nr:hypothetical protein QQS21_000810 [Conoideocrella luteorostrata]